ncbi:hypothetical protein CUMW_165440 [Citrus unshiu]|nr:hypothetical protein CUMW_165440 [Citrus unshiu]
MTLKCAIQLGIPDAFHNHQKPMTINELADAQPMHPKNAKYVVPSYADSSSQNPSLIESQ